MKTVQKQIVLTVSWLLLAASSGSAQVLSPVYSFSDTNGINSMAGLLLSGSTLYGTTFASGGGGAKSGGQALAGTVFKVNTDGTGFTNLHVFSPVYSGPNPITNTDGGDSEAQLVLSGNRLYGTASKGGFNANGIIFAINTDGTGFTNLYNFSAVDYNSRTNSDGAIPSIGLVLSGDTLYGTTDEGGFNAGGTVFAIHADGTGFTNLYSFTIASGSPRARRTACRRWRSNSVLQSLTPAGVPSWDGTGILAMAGPTALCKIQPTLTATPPVSFPV